MASCLKNGTELFYNDGNPTPFTLYDFWTWSGSDLLSNATRGKLAEFIVATATQFDFNNIRKDWDEYDILTADRIKIEVKSSAYIQSWEQKCLSKIIFSIKKNNDLGCRCSDVYVFCILKHKDRQTINPLNLSQWEFYVLPTAYIDRYQRSQTQITINSLRKISFPTNYSELQKHIKVASVIQKQTLQAMTTEQYQTLLALYKLKLQGADIEHQLKEESLKANLEFDKAKVHKLSTDDYKEYINEIHTLLYEL